VLYLNRKLGEAVRVGDNVTITVLEIDTVRGKVRLGIEAPKEVGIYRSEIWADVQRRLKEEQEGQT
jgi:carbon storage regulator